LLRKIVCDHIIVGNTNTPMLMITERAASMVASQTA
jgi:hypothetical protein